MSQISVIQVRGETVKVDMDRMMELIASGIDANTAILESIVEAVPGGQVCKLVGQNHFQEIYEDSGRDDKKAMEIFRQRNPKGYECMFVPDPQQGTPPRDAVDMIRENPSNNPADDNHIALALGVIHTLDPSKVSEFQNRLPTLGSTPTFRQVLELARSLVGVDRFDAEIERRVTIR